MVERSLDYTKPDLDFCLNLLFQINEFRPKIKNR
ncbi:MAG: hypothetical protein ACI8WM_000185 [Burkholderiaceae bacterium]|jgi:hypothetical protein